MADAETTGTEHAEQLSAVVTDRDGVRVVTLAGEIDHHTGDTLRRGLDGTGVPGLRVVADMHQVTFMDSSGINILIAAHTALMEAGGWLRVAAARNAVKRTLGLVGVDAFIDCRDTLEEALAD
ncbi:stage II sporulation protein AA (anti-sigma F factor antagonist) [Streptomyces sp. BK208]|uniref:STAS domain-containing protein n=1 Tax=Streptomyces sp. BK208 TaxID=2512150 RepID=UPI00105D1859|nr:STAS domain-containing protein [Streptomyces sp. BK208]TDT42158.1 stage II sporulation protein AA (anti-sigma F factor antagonist) [Streptomyces sp. BK208]